jgi:hypothetical protein
MRTAEIESMIQDLPDDLRSEVMDYIEFLVQRKRRKTKKKGSFRFDWEGGLSDLKDQYTSVELQHKASEWR